MARRKQVSSAVDLAVAVKFAAVRDLRSGVSKAGYGIEGL